MLFYFRGGRCFINADGKDYGAGILWPRNYVTRVFREMLLKNGFRPIRYHDLRHSCASLLIKNKVTMKEVQMWLGHSSFSTTANIYAHIDVDSKMEAANMIASEINLGELPEKKEISQTKNRLGEKLRWANLSAKTNGK